MAKYLRLVDELRALRPYHRAMRAAGDTHRWRTVPYGPHKRQYSLLAEQADPHAPVVVWFHGGAWQFGAPDRLLAFGEYFYRRGYTVWLPSHRRLPRYTGVDILADARTALRAAERYHAAPPQILLGGMSSGGHLAALNALRPDAWRASAAIRGLITCGAPLSLDQLGASPTRLRFAGRRSTRAYPTLDPVHQLTEARPDFPALVIHGTRDGLVPYRCAVHFASEAKRLGWRDLEFQTLTGGAHLDSASWIWE